MRPVELNMEAEFLSIKDQLSSYLYRLTANKEDAEDLVHDTYLKVHKNISNFRRESEFKTWVFTIATNLARDHKRVNNRWGLDAQDKCKQAAIEKIEVQQRMKGAFGSQVEQSFDIKEHINYCFTCVAKNLSLEKQLAVILKEVYDFKRTEIAEILNCSEGVVKHLLFDGRKELQDKFEQRCALINKTGVCYQCAQLNDYFQVKNDAQEKVKALKLSPNNSSEQNLDLRLEIIQQINPLKGNGALLEDTILQILREEISDN